jgi:cytochrome c2
MSGMPAWGYRISDAEMWDIVAFVESMPGLSPEEYASLDAKATASLGQHQAHRSSPAARAVSTPSAPPPVAATEPDIRPAAAPSLGDVAAGRHAVKQYLCATCHEIPGITSATRHVGPPLNGIAKRRYIGGVIRNTPENMVRWLQDPKQFDPLSAMPALGVSDQDARDMAAFLYTLEDVE